MLVDRSGKYYFNALPGKYFIHFFADSNNDGVYQPREKATYVGLENGRPQEIQLRARQDLTLDAATIRHTIDTQGYADVEDYVYNFENNIGKIVSLSDPIFVHDNAKMGVWRPIDYLSTFGGGLYFLRDYDPNTIPVIFVHGMFGTASEFKLLIETLDQDRYQPWVLQYPSGLRLEMVSNFLAYAIDNLQQQLGFSEIVIVAHSMGGLIVHSYVKKYAASNRNYSLGLVMTINTPLRGMESAKSGLQYSPIIVPVWRDLAPNSHLINELNAWSWPNDVPYQLVYSFLPGEEGDGVVPLSSQLTPKRQQEANNVRRFQAQHAEILRNPDFVSWFTVLLDDEQDKQKAQQ